MTGDQQRDAQPEYKLGDFDGGVAKMAALVERPEPEQEMNGDGGVEREIDDRNSPPPDMKAESGLHRGVGEIAERVIEEVRENVGKHDEAAEEPHLPNSDSLQPPHDGRGLECGARIHDYRGVQGHVEFVRWLPDN